MIALLLAAPSARADAPKAAVAFLTGASIFLAGFAIGGVLVATSASNDVQDNAGWLTMGAGGSEGGYDAPIRWRRARDGPPRRMRDGAAKPTRAPCRPDDERHRRPTRRRPSTETLRHPRGRGWRRRSHRRRRLRVSVTWH